MDAAYTVFKKEPSSVNAARHYTATQAFTSFCVESMKALADDLPVDNTEHILANMDTYKACKQCSTELLYPISENQYVEKSDFVPDFPGWCHTCLVEHCKYTECGKCTLTEDPGSCAYKEIKNIYIAAE